MRFSICFLSIWLVHGALTAFVYHSPMLWERQKQKLTDGDKVFKANLELTTFCDFLTKPPFEDSAFYQRCLDQYRKLIIEPVQKVCQSTEKSKSSLVSKIGGELPLVRKTRSVTSVILPIAMKAAVTIGPSLMGAVGKLILKILTERKIAKNAKQLKRLEQKLDQQLSELAANVTHLEATVNQKLMLIHLYDSAITSLIASVSGFSATAQGAPLPQSFLEALNITHLYTHLSYGPNYFTPDRAFYLDFCELQNGTNSSDGSLVNLELRFRTANTLDDLSIFKSLYVEMLVNGNESDNCLNRYVGPSYVVYNTSSNELAPYVEFSRDLEASMSRHLHVPTGHRELNYTQLSDQLLDGYVQLDCLDEPVDTQSLLRVLRATNGFYVYCYGNAIRYGPPYFPIQFDCPNEVMSVDVKKFEILRGGQRVGKYEQHLNEGNGSVNFGSIWQCDEELGKDYNFTRKMLEQTQLAYAYNYSPLTFVTRNKLAISLIVISLILSFLLLLKMFAIAFESTKLNHGLDLVLCCFWSNSETNPKAPKIPKKNSLLIEPN